VRTPDTATLTNASPLGLVRQTDALGVLSIYVDTAPGQQDPGPRGSEVDIKNRLAQLKRAIRSDGTPRRSRALEDLLQRLSRELERLLDPTASGQGRALFAELSSERVTRLECQMPVPNRVVLDSSAFVHPLIELLDEGRPAGVVLASTREPACSNGGSAISSQSLGSNPRRSRHLMSGPDP
jgi:hypothetical protein